MRKFKKVTGSICFIVLLTIFSMAIGCQSEADKAIIHREKMRQIDSPLDAASQNAEMEMNAAARRLGL